MSQIEITVLKQGTPSDKVLSVSFFKMVGGYRDFSRYEMGLKQFLKQSTQLKTFEVRIYTDETAADVCLHISDVYPNVSVYKYNCPAFHEGDGHTGTFGTIVRFLPLFDPSLSVVWISDIDIRSDFLDPKLLHVMKANNCQVFIDSMFCYDRRPWANVKYPIVAHRFISFITYPRQLLTRFLTRLANGELADLIQEINQYNTRKTENLRFPYGMDEAFMNSVLYRNLKKHNVKILFRKDYFIPNFLVYTIENFPIEAQSIFSKFYRTPTSELFQKSKQIFKKYLPMIVDKYPCAQEYIDNLDNLKKTFAIIKIINSNDL